MRILYFHQYFSTPQGSTGTRSYEFAKKLISNGHLITMVCIRHDQIDLNLEYDPENPHLRRGNIDGINVLQYDIKYSNHMSLLKRSIVFLRFAIHSIRIAMKEDYDVIFSTSTPLTAGIPGIFARYLRGKKFIFEVRDLWPELPRTMGVVKNPLVIACMIFLEWLSYRAASACVALSPGIAEGIAKRSPQNRSIIVIPNGCDVELFHPGKKSKFELPGIETKDFVAIFTGAHGIANGLDSVLDAAHVIKRKGRSNIKFVFIGDGKLKPELIKRSENENLDNCLFYNPVSKIELSKIVSSADVGLMILSNVPAFYYGTSPNKFFDYISSGLPVINNYPGWLADIIKTYKCGIAVSPEDPDALADALCFLADNSHLRTEYGHNSRKIAESLFNRDILANRFLEWIENVVAGSVEKGIQEFK